MSKTLPKHVKERKLRIHATAQKARTDAYRKGIRGSNLYFAYGSNLHIEQMKSRCPTAVPISSGTLTGWKLTFRGVADIVEGAEDDIVYGALFRIESKDEHALDVYEGYPNLYVKRYVTVRTARGNVRAMVYVMRDTNRVSKPSDYYFDIIREGFKNWSLPAVVLHDARRIAVKISAYFQSVQRHNALYQAEQRAYVNGVTADEQMDDFIQYVSDAEEEALLAWARSLNG